MAYSPSNADIPLGAARLVDKILRGAKLADLPVEPPTRFEPVINLKTAKAIRLRKNRVNLDSWRGAGIEDAPVAGRRGASTMPRSGRGPTPVGRSVRAIMADAARHRALGLPRCLGDAAASGAGTPHLSAAQSRALLDRHQSDDRSDACAGLRPVDSGTVLAQFSSVANTKMTLTAKMSPPLGEVSPVRRRLATLFVDIAGSTSLLVHHPPEIVLGVVQGFLSLVTEIASAHAGMVKDFEGDGALIYFASVKNAVRAALAIRRRLADGRCDVACGDGPGIRARTSVTIGDVVVGRVGSSTRQGIALVGPSVNIGARLLKHAPLGAIIASSDVLADLQDAPQLADEFHPLDAAFVVPGADGMTVETYIVPPAPAVAAMPTQFNCSPGS